MVLAQSMRPLCRERERLVHIKHAARKERTEPAALATGCNHPNSGKTKSEVECRIRSLPLLVLYPELI